MQAIQYPLPPFAEALGMVPKATPDRHEHDFYSTPAHVVRGLRPFLPERLGDVLDPAAGDGVFQQELGDMAFEWMNIDIRADAKAVECVIESFLGPPDDSMYGFDTIITNPPFNLIEPFIEQAHALKPRRIIYLARLSLLEGKGRFVRIWQRYPPSRVIVLVQRPRFRPDKGSDRWSYAFFCWGDMPPGPAIQWQTGSA